MGDELTLADRSKFKNLKIKLKNFHFIFRGYR